MIVAVCAMDGSQHMAATTKKHSPLEQKKQQQQLMIKHKQSKIAQHSMEVLTKCIESNSLHFGTSFTLMFENVFRRIRKMRYLNRNKEKNRATIFFSKSNIIIPK